MVDIKQSNSTSTGLNQGHYHTDSCKISNQSHLTGDMVVGEKGIKLCSSNETASDYLLNRTTTTSTSVSTDSSDNSTHTSAEILFSLNTDIIGSNDLEDHGKCAQRKPSISELAGERLYCQAKERSKRMASLAVKNSTDSMEMHHGTTFTVSSTRIRHDVKIGPPKSPSSETLRPGIESVKIIRKLRLNSTGSIRSTFDVHSAENHTKIAKHREDLRWSKLTKMKDIKSKVHPDDNTVRGKLSVSEIAGCRLHLKAAERNKRLALLRKAYHKNQPNLNLQTVARNLSLMPKSGRSRTPSVIQMKDIKSNVHLDNDLERGPLSVSEIAGCRLYLKAAERNKRLALLRKEYNKDQPKLNLQTIARPLSLLPKAHRSPTPGMIQMNDIKPTVHPDNNKGRGRLSVSEIAGCRLHLKSMERNKRLALLRKEKNQSKLNLQTIARPLSLMSKIDHNSTPSYTRLCKQAELNRRKSEGLTSNGTDIFNISSCCGWNGDRPFQRLYALSKSMQEDGRKRRKSIAEASEKAKEVWTHPTEKISIADSTRLYYIGMRKYIALEQRIIETSEPGVYKTRLILPLQSC